MRQERTPVLGERTKLEDQSGQGEKGNSEHKGRFGSLMSHYHISLPGFMETSSQEKEACLLRIVSLDANATAVGHIFHCFTQDSGIERIVRPSNLHIHCQKPQYSVRWDQETKDWMAQGTCLGGKGGWRGLIPHFSNLKAPAMQVR